MFKSFCKFSINLFSSSDLDKLSPSFGLTPPKVVNKSNCLFLSKFLMSCFVINPPPTLEAIASLGKAWFLSNNLASFSAFCSNSLTFNVAWLGFICASLTAVNSTPLTPCLPTLIVLPSTTTSPVS